MEAFNLVHAIRAIFDAENGLNQHERLVMACLSRRADSTGECYPSITRISEECAISRPTAIKAINGLIEKGWLSAKKQRGSTTIYTLHIPENSVENEPETSQPRLPDQSTTFTSKPDLPVNQIYRGSKPHLLPPVNDVDWGSKPRLPEVTHLSNPIEVTQLSNSHNYVSSAPKRRSKKPPKALKAIRRKYPDSFERFWLAYPRKVGKSDAYDVWQLLVDNDVGEERLLAAACNYAEYVKQNNIEERYVQHGKTFLNGTWQDYETRASPSGKTRDRPNTTSEGVGKYADLYQQSGQAMSL